MTLDEQIEAGMLQAQILAAQARARAHAKTTEGRTPVPGGPFPAGMSAKEKLATAMEAQQAQQFTSGPGGRRQAVLDAVQAQSGGENPNALAELPPGPETAFGRSFDENLPAIGATAASIGMRGLKVNPRAAKGAFDALKRLVFKPTGKPTGKLIEGGARAGLGGGCRRARWL